MQSVRTIGLWLILGLMTMTAACDKTIRGVGQDIEDSGEAIEDSVE